MVGYILTFYIYFRTIPTRGKLKFTGFLCTYSSWFIHKPTILNLRCSISSLKDVGGTRNLSPVDLTT